MKKLNVVCLLVLLYTCDCVSAQDSDSKVLKLASNSCPYQIVKIPGATDEERWHWLQIHLPELVKSNRQQVLKLFHTQTDKQVLKGQITEAQNTDDSTSAYYCDIRLDSDKTNSIVVFEQVGRRLRTIAKAHE